METSHGELLALRVTSGCKPISMVSQPWPAGRLSLGSNRKLWGRTKTCYGCFCAQEILWAKGIQNSTSNRPVWGKQNNRRPPGLVMRMAILDMEPWKAVSTHTSSGMHLNGTDAEMFTKRTWGVFLQLNSKGHNQLQKCLPGATAQAEAPHFLSQRGSGGLSPHFVLEGRSDMKRCSW